MSIPVYEEGAGGITRRRATEFEVGAPAARAPKTDNPAQAFSGAETAGTLPAGSGSSRDSMPTIIEIDLTGRPLRAYTPAEVKKTLRL